VALSAAEQAELDQLNKEVGHLAPTQSAQGPSRLSPQEQVELDQLNKEVGHLDSKPTESQKESPGLMGQAIDALSKGHGPGSLFFKGMNVLRNGGGEVIRRGMDLPGGPMRMGLASVAGQLTGKPNVVTDEDFKNAAVGNAPSSDEYMQRLGVPEGPSVGIPFTDKRISARNAAGFVGDVVTNPLTYVGGGLLGAAGEGTAAAGKGMYRSAFKPLDLEAASAGKGESAVSDLMLKSRVSGSSKEIFNQMNNIGEKLLQGRNDILKRATRAGAEVDMNKAVGEAQTYIDQLKKIDNPETREAVRMLEARIGEYQAVAAKESEQVLRELPTSKYVPEYREIKGYKPAQEELLQLPTSKLTSVQSVLPEVSAYDTPTLSNPGHGAESWSGQDLLQSKGGRLRYVPNEPVLRDDFDKVMSLPRGSQYENKFVPSKDVGLIQNPAEVIYGREVPARYEPGRPEVVLDQSERMPGPTPIQTTAWKSTAANRVGDKGYEQLAKSPMGKAFDKKLAAGLRGATEDSVREALGEESARGLIEHNADLGTILSSDKQALNELEKEARKNGFTSVDGMLLTHPGMLATKKVADISKLPAFRTSAGLGLMDIGNSGAVDPLVRQAIINALTKDKKKQESPLDDIRLSQ
jgi:hypothetical protein